MGGLGMGLGLGLSRARRKGGGVDLAAQYLARVTSGETWGFSDPTRVYVDFQGLSQATAAGNAIGLFLGNRQWGGRTLTQELAVQPELISNPTFDTDIVGWVNATGGPGTIAWDSGAIVCSDVGGGDGVAQTTFTSVVGSLYRFGWKVLSTTGGWLTRIRNSTDFQYNYSVALGSFSAIVRSSAVSNTSQLLSADTNKSTAFDDVSVKLIPGAHGRQPTGGNCGTSQAGGALRVATDDGYPTGLLPGKFVMARAKLTGGSGTRVAVGASGSATARFNSYFNSSGQAACRVGDGAEIAAGADRTGVDGTIGLRIRAGDGEVDLVIDGVVAATGTLSGAPTTVQGLAIGASNNNGTLGSFFTGDFLTGANGTSIIAGDAVPTDAEMAALHAYLMAA